MKRSYLLVTAAVVFAITALVGARSGVAAESIYTSIAEKSCRKFGVLRIAGDEFAASRICEGRGGYKVYVSEDDLRETLTVGKTQKQAGREPAAHDHYGAFNSYDDTVEWRNGADGKPTR